MIRSEGDEQSLPGPPAWQRAALAAAFSLLLSVVTLVVSGVPMSELGVFFDGHLYIQIARSYPLPYDAGAHLYASHAPGYPAFIALARSVVPDALFQWAELAVLVSWLASAASAAVFYLLTRAWGITSLWPAILFVAANPRGLVAATSAHAEPLAMLFALSALLFFVRDRTGWSLAFLTLATLCRFNALTLGVPIAFGLLIERRRWDLRTLLWLALPLLVLGLLHLYLDARIPDFVSVWHAHQPLWPTRLVFPFQPLFSGRAAWPLLPLREVTYAMLALYCAAFVLGLRPSLRPSSRPSLRPSVRHGRVLALWILAVSLIPLSLSGGWGLVDFVRLAILGWPVALLIVWATVGARLPRAGVAVLAAAATVFSVWFAAEQIKRGVNMQRTRQPHVASLLEQIDSDEPVWLEEL